MSGQSASNQAAQAAGLSFSIPRPRSLGKFIIFPSMWRLPNFKAMPVLYRRAKTNLLYFQTNYLILMLIFFVIFTIFSMKTLLSGFVSAAVIVVAILFFFEHIPQARQIKQNHPSVVIIAGIILVFVTWHALHTILLIVVAFLAPLPLCFLHAITRSSDFLVDSSMTREYFVKTPVGQIMQIIGIDPKPSLVEI